MIEVSKELLSEVLNVEISEVTGMLTHKNNKSLLSYITKNCSINDGKELINIYELAHKCKEWAYNNGGYVLESRSYNQKQYKWVKQGFCYTHLPIDGMGNQNWEDTEVEAIIKACEWILNKLNKKD